MNDQTSLTQILTDLDAKLTRLEREYGIIREEVTR